MAATFPTSPTDGEYAVVNSITYVYDSANRSWTRVPGGGGGGGTPGGANTQVQYNNAGSFAGSAGLTFDYNTNALATTGTFNATGNITGGNIIIGSGVTGLFLGSLPGGGGGAIYSTNVTPALANSALNTNANYTNINGILGVGITINATAVLTANSAGFGTTGVISAGGNIYAGGHVGTIYTNSIINTGSNATGNIGGTGAYFNTVFAKATSAQYADVAEWYSSDAGYEPGTVVVFDGSAEVTISTTNGDDKVAGVVSTNPAYIMNAGIQSEYAVPVALTGRVPTKVIGPVKKGNMMISAGNGYAQACSTPAIGTVIGKALENFDKQNGIIEIVVGRL